MLKRNIKSRIEKALKRSPVVLLLGARQVGKTILTESLAEEKNYRYLTLDDIPTYLAAKNDPVSFIGNIPKPIVIDEVQRVPELFLAIKRNVDSQRSAGDYLLTGSVNPFLMPKVVDALTGRIETLSLLPLSQGEILGIKEEFIDVLFAGKNPVISKKPLSKNSLYEKIITGGFPVLQQINAEDRQVWISEYIKSLVHKDAQDITKISDPTDLYAFVYSAAYRASGLVNISDISRNLHIPQATLQRYTSLLEALFMIYFVQPWHMKSEKRFVKSKKMYFIDSGFLSNLLKIYNIDALKDSSSVGAILENFVVMELLKQLGWSKTNAALYHFRTSSGVEVDIVLEDDAHRIVAIEVKNSSTVSSDDFYGLTYLKDLVKDKFVKGIILYTGESIIPFGDKLLAVPISSLWTNK